MWRRLSLMPPDVLILVFTFQKSALYELAHVNRKYYSDSASARATRKRMQRQCYRLHAEKVFREEMHEMWVTQQQDYMDEASLPWYRQWWCWLVRKGVLINRMLRRPETLSWRLDIYRFANRNAHVPTEERRVQIDANNDDHEAIYILPIWFPEPIHWRDPGSDGDDRNEHLTEKDAKIQKGTAVTAREADSLAEYIDAQYDSDETDD